MMPGCNKRKYHRPILLFLALSISFNTMAQSDSSKIFEHSKGHWKLPLTSFEKIDDYKEPPKGFSGDFMGPEIAFYTDSPCVVHAVFDGTVVGVFQIGDSYALMTRFGNYFITYAGLNTPTFKKGAFIKAGQIISGLYKYDSADYKLEVIISSTKIKRIDPYNWFAWKTR
jgi:hypothetical protein